ncbi:hypothetical protein KR009_004997 [Drosophila setifemur]|nr:hypothetical protein KR009_004997 [Drosophila setifemur]
MIIMTFEYFWRKLVNGLDQVMGLAEESRLIMMGVSCAMALVFILNVQSGSVIFQDLILAVTTKRARLKLARQPSPIHILGSRVSRRRLLLPLQWTNYGDLPLATILENNGSTVILKICTSPEAQPHLSGGELGGIYYFVEAIFKWGIQRSEHSIDAHRFSLEIQALHRCHQHPSSNQYLAISYLFLMTPNKNKPLQQISENLLWLLQPGSTIELPPFDLGSLMQPFTAGYYTYLGTYDNGEELLPTTWLIDSRIFGVSSHQLAQFKSLCRNDGSKINSNVRHEQALGSRCVQFHP